MSASYNQPSVPITLVVFSCVGAKVKYQGGITFSIKHDLCMCIQIDCKYNIHDFCSGKTSEASMQGCVCVALPYPTLPYPTVVRTMLIVSQKLRISCQITVLIKNIQKFSTPLVGWQRYLNTPLLPCGDFNEQLSISPPPNFEMQQHWGWIETEGTSKFCYLAYMQTKCSSPRQEI